MLYNTSSQFGLTHGDMADILQLQAAVSCSLKRRGQCGFLIPREEEAYNRHLSSGLPILGIRSKDGDLTAACLLSDQRKPNFHQNFNLSGASASKTIAVEGVLIHPTEQGNGIGSELLKIAISHAFNDELNIIDIVAKIRFENLTSKSLFEGKGFSSYSVMEDRRGDASCLRRSICSPL